MARHKSMLLLCILWILLGTISALNDEGTTESPLAQVFENLKVWTDLGKECELSTVVCEQVMHCKIFVTGLEMGLC